MPEPGRPPLQSAIGRATPDAITVRGLDLAGELMGQVSFVELAYLLATGRRPTPAQVRVFDAGLVALADHGLTPSVLAARLTLTGAPEALQGAVAAGLLGGGSALLGPTEDAARFLAGVLAAAGPDADEAALEQAAATAVRARAAARERIPGLGHPLHKDGDPRVPRLYAIAAEEGLLGPHLALLRVVHGVAGEVTGRKLPINGAGAVGAALADAGLPIDLLRGFSLLARVAGLLGHLAEEREHPLGPGLWRDAEERLDYVAEPPD
ncbi:MAG TPA: citryl-CoA lyase [Baekduia sp.]|nr:citryl-CoA lyase [Baekduia sp.]